MSRRDLIHEGCILAREGSNHSIWDNPATGRRAAVARHRDISNMTDRAICRQLDIAEP